PRYYSVKEMTPKVHLRVIPKNIVEELGIPQALPAVQINIVVSPGAPPGRPTPDPHVMAKNVTIRGQFAVGKEIVAAYHHDSLIIAIFFQEFVAEAEKAGVRETIVLKKNGLLDGLEYPI